jgi:hypothetical protein
MQVVHVRKEAQLSLPNHYQLYIDYKTADQFGSNNESSKENFHDGKSDQQGRRHANEQCSREYSACLELSSLDRGPQLNAID